MTGRPGGCQPPQASGMFFLTFLAIKGKGKIKAIL
jgi:hypothetical protein